jgi:hypothetical protein
MIIISFILVIIKFKDFCFIIYLINCICIHFLDCWDNEPSNRPITSQVVERLKEIISKTNLNPSDDSNNNIIGNKSLRERQSNTTIAEYSLSMQFQFDASQFKQKKE